jgi:predicted lysophospholipase L1 biosynthesis ABC-type transport system permease subunit
MWARADVRARWRALVALAVLAGVAAGVALAAVAGARRTDAALDRLRDETDAADAIVFATQVGNFAPDWDALEARPEVEALAPWALIFGDLAGEPGQVVFGSVDGRWGGEVNRSVVTEGRMFDPRAVDEAVVDEEAAREEGVEVGDVVPFQAELPGGEFDPAPARGPEVDLRVVGLTRNVGQFLFTGGILMVSPGLLERHGEELAVATNADVRLTPGGSGIDALTQDVNEIVGPGTPVLDLDAVRRRIDTTTDVEHTALLLLGGVVAVAGAVLVGQALGRSASVVGDDAPALRAMGFTRAAIGSAAVLSHAGVAVLAALVAAATAVVASQWFPVGLARRIDPDVGVHLDLPVVLPGMAVTAVLIVLGAAATGISSTVAQSTTRRHQRPGISAWVRRVAPVTVGLGTTMALERERRRGGVPVAPALLAAVVGVLGVVATMQIDHGLDEALDHPERAGVTWDAGVLPVPEDHTAEGVAPGLTDLVADAPDVRDTAVVDRALVDVDGTGVPTFALRPTAGTSTSITLALVHGRAPTSPGEAAIGPHTADQLGVGMGDEVVLGDGDRRVRIVGEALFPTDVHSEFDEGLWVTQPDLLAAVPSPEVGTPDSGVARRVVVAFAPGTDAEAATGTLAEQVGDRAVEVLPADVPPELANLRNVRTLPVVLSVVLAVLAVAALGHVLLTSARRRRRDFAVLRALGLTRRGGRVVLNAQGTAVGLVGLVLGVPLGIAAGRRGWDWVASSVPLRAVPPFAAVAVLLLVPIALVVANVVAVWPGRRVARLRPAQVLRTE